MHITGLMYGSIDRPRAIHIYRITMPLGYINKMTKHVANWTDVGHAAQALTTEQVKSIYKSDIIILGRPIVDTEEEAVRYIRSLKSRGAKVVYETDDDLTEIHRDISSGRDMNCIPFLHHCDAVTCTTEPLKNMLSQFTSKNIYVLPNCVEPSYWATVCDNYERQYNSLNIMLLGTPTHGNDWNLAAQAIDEVLDKYEHVHLLVGGYHPEYIKERDRVHFLPYREYYAYPTMLAEADIVVAAIDPDDKFNHSKSAVKAMESWSARRKISGSKYGGAAVVATKSVVYNGTVIDQVNGLLVEHSVTDYREAIESLIEDESLRHRLQVRGYNDVRKKHSIAANYQSWVSVYNKVMRS